LGFTFAGSYSHVDIAFATLATWQELRYGDSANGRFSAVAIQASDGVVFQSANLFPSLTALQQLELVAHIDGRLDGAARTRANELLATVGLGSRLNARLLADEPTASLDAECGEAVKNLLVEQATERGTATLIVTTSRTR
jgi:predicted ABC-type transport system involved in lysophospholipase L1 biosynthesis ATPase subunit